MQRLHIAGNTLRPHYKSQPVNAVWGNSRCLLSEKYGEPKGAVQTGVQPTSPKILVQVEDDKGGAGTSLREAIKQA
jgi:hypothetical protein